MSPVSGNFVMQRVAIAVVLSGFLAACGQQAPAKGEAGAPVGALDYIDAVPIDENAPPPVIQAQPTATKDEPETETKADETDKAETPAATAAVAPPSPEPATKADDATAATRRANETTATP